MYLWDSNILRHYAEGNFMLQEHLKMPVKVDTAASVVALSPLPNLQTLWYNLHHVDLSTKQPMVQPGLDLTSPSI